MSTVHMHALVQEHTHTHTRMHTLVCTLYVEKLHEV